MFGREEVAAAVEMRSEADALIGNFAQLREAVDLESTGVSQHGARPTDEAMQSTHAANRVVSRTKIEMISVAENDLCAECFNNVLGHGLYAARSSHRHEYWRLHGLVRQMHLRAPSAGLGCVQQVECEAHLVILVRLRFLTEMRSLEADFSLTELRLGPRSLRMTPANEGRNFGFRILAMKYRAKCTGSPFRLPAWLRVTHCGDACASHGRSCARRSSAGDGYCGDRS